jgi:hypothetical protein
MKNIMISMLSMVFVIATQSSVSANEKFSFEQIMKMMEGADIRYERLGHYGDIPFKLENKGDQWVFTQMRNMYSGTIKSAGANRLLVEGFGPRWTILGTWDFKKVGDTCKINHTLRDSTGSEPMEMVWACKSK